MMWMLHLVAFGFAAPSLPAFLACLASLRQRSAAQHRSNQQRAQPLKIGSKMASEDLISQLGTEAASATSGQSTTLVNLQDIKKRVMSITSARAAWGPPIANGELHGPRKENSACRLATPSRRDGRRSWSQPGQWRKYALLVREGRGPRAIAKLIDNNENEGCKWVLLVFLWEDRYNDPTTCLVRVVEDVPDELSTMVFIEQSSSMESTLTIGIFWPVPVYKRIDRQDPPKKDLVLHKHNGVNIKGVFRDRCHGQPIGTYVVNHRCAQSARKVSEVGNSKQSSHGMEEINDIWACLMGRMQVTIAPTEKADGEKGADAKVKAKAAIQDDGLDDFWDTSVVNFKGSASGSGSSRPAGSGGQADSKKAEQEGKAPTPKKLKTGGRGNMSSMFRNSMFRCFHLDTITTINVYLFFSGEGVTPTW